MMNSAPGWPGISPRGAAVGSSSGLGVAQGRQAVAPDGAAGLVPGDGRVGQSREGCHIVPPRASEHFLPEAAQLAVVGGRGPIGTDPWPVLLRDDVPVDDSRRAVVVGGDGRGRVFRPLEREGGRLVIAAGAPVVDLVGPLGVVRLPIVEMGPPWLVFGAVGEQDYEDQDHDRDQDGFLVAFLHLARDPRPWR